MNEIHTYPYLWSSVNSLVNGFNYQSEHTIVNDTVEGWLNDIYIYTY